MRNRSAADPALTRIPAPPVGSHDADLAPLGAASPLRVAITADQRLLADMAAAALSGVGVHTTTVEWPTNGSGDAVAGRLLGFRPHVCLSLHDLENPAVARVAELLLSDGPYPWVVLATSEPGSAWGGALHAGAQAVLPGRLSMAELVASLRHAAVRSEVMDPGQRQEVVLAWSRASERREELAAHVERLTPREVGVLEHLYQGERVCSIANDFGVTESTVRSQVKSMLRKLGVGSQIAAVAVYREVRDGRSETIDRSEPGEDARAAAQVGEPDTA